jgi:NAD(P) transhydrogenase subunit alpha
VSETEGSLDEPAHLPANRTLRLAVLKEEAPGEARVALVPDAVGRLAPLGIEVLVEAGAGAGALLPDAAYAAAGARILDAETCMAEGDGLLAIAAPSRERIATMRPGQLLVGLLQPLVRPELAERLAGLGVTALSLDLLPRRLSRAQSMDALSSQANVAGYKAVLVAANAFGRYFPMLVTAAGTSKPAQVLVLGAGVAGLQAMGTARRLGAVVTGYDVRPETRAEIESVGARFLDLRSVGPAAGEGGYARALTAEEQAAQQEELNDHVARFDIVITTAQVPGRRPPVLVTEAALERLQTGSVVVDLAASDLGGNVEGSPVGGEVLTKGGVRILGAGNLPSQVPAAASTAYATNLVALLRTLVHDGELIVDPEDEIHAGLLVTRDGKVVHPAVQALIEGDGPDGPLEGQAEQPRATRENETKNETKEETG